MFLDKQSNFVYVIYCHLYQCSYINNQIQLGFCNDARVQLVFIGPIYLKMCHKTTDYDILELYLHCMLYNEHVYNSGGRGRIGLIVLMCYVFQNIN